MKALDTVQRSVNITKTQICVDSVQDGEPSGFLYNPYMPERIAFFGYLSLINVMDRFFDRMQCPQAYYQYRAWQAKKSDQRQPEKEVTRFMAEEALHSKKRRKSYLYHSGTVPAKRHLAGNHRLDGKQKDSAIPQCAGNDQADR